MFRMNVAFKKKEWELIIFSTTRHKTNRVKLSVCQILPYRVVFSIIQSDRFHWSKRKRLFDVKLINKHLGRARFNVSSKAKSCDSNQCFNLGKKVHSSSHPIRRLEEVNVPALWTAMSVSCTTWSLCRSVLFFQIYENTHNFISYLTGISQLIYNFSVTQFAYINMIV